MIEREGPLTIQRIVELLGDLAVEHGDNPNVPATGERDWISDEARKRIRAWEEAPLLDEIALNAGYRSTLFNLGLALIEHHRLGEHPATCGGELAAGLGVDEAEFEYICRCLLDEMRVRRCLRSRDALLPPKPSEQPAIHWSGQLGKESKMAKWPRVRSGGESTCAFGHHDAAPRDQSLEPVEKARARRTFTKPSTYLQPPTGPV